MGERASGDGKFVATVIGIEVWKYIRSNFPSRHDMDFTFGFDGRDMFYMWGCIFQICAAPSSQPVSLPPPNYAISLAMRHALPLPISGCLASPHAQIRCNKTVQQNKSKTKNHPSILPYSVAAGVVWSWTMLKQ